MAVKIKIFIAAVIFFHSLHLNGQIHIEMGKINVDSLQQILPELDGTDKIDAINKLSLAFCLDFPDSSMAFANQTIAMSKKLDYQKGLADGYFNRGNVFFFLDSLKLMVINYLEALRIYENLGPSMNMGLVYYQLTLVNNLTGRPEQSKKYCRKAIHTYQSIGEHRNQIEAIYKMGRICSFNYEWDSAFYYFDSALALLKTYPDNWILAGVYNQYGFNYAHQFWEGEADTGTLLKGIPWFFKGWEIDKKYNGAVETTTPIYNIGASLISTGTEENIQEGLKYIYIVKKIIDTCRIKIHAKLTCYRRLAENEYRKGNHKKAIALYKKGLSLADSSMQLFSMKNYVDPNEAYIDKYHYKLNKQISYSELYEIYMELGDYKKAIEYYILKEKAAEEIYLEENTNLVSMLEAESENEKTEKKIALLAHDKEVNEMKVKQSRLFNIGVVVLFVILFLVGFLFLRQNKLKNEHKSVVLEQKLLRLQMNPHFIFNALSNILKFVDTNENDKASGYLTTFSKLLRSTLESTRENMIPFEKEVGSLRNYLELQKLRYGAKFNYAIEVDEKIDQEDMSIPPMLVQPFIENAIEHGIRHKKTPGRIDVRFFLKDKKILCEVEDNGVGRERAWETEVKERSGHKSLATEIILDRIKVLNKKFRQKISLEIIDKVSESQEAIGTKVMIDLPYSNVY